MEGVRNHPAWMDVGRAKFLFHHGPRRSSPPPHLMTVRFDCDCLSQLGDSFASERTTFGPLRDSISASRRRLARTPAVLVECSDGGRSYAKAMALMRGKKSPYQN